jgi:uncharacterized protein (TIGR00251 family)
MSSGPVRAKGDDSTIDVVVVPRASRSRVVGLHGDRLKVQLAAAPVEGAANDELVGVIADALALPRSAVVLERGHAAKRKTLRVVGLGEADVRRRLGLAALLLGLASQPACNPITTEIDIAVLVPEDAPELAGIDNATAVLAPDGFSETFAADGLDFGFAVELDPDQTQRTLTLYLANGETLLAWGRTPEFSYAAADNGLALFVGRPSALSTFPLVLDPPDAGLLLAYAEARGLVAVSSEGDVEFIDEHTLVSHAASALVLDDVAPDPADGTLVGDPRGGVQRLVWNAALAGARFDVDTNAWTPLSLVGAAEAGAREGAAWARACDGACVRLVGGGGRSDVADIALSADEDGTQPIAIVAALDAPRPGAHALAVRRDPSEVTFVAGGADAPSLVHVVEPALSLGDAQTWTDSSCIALDAAATGATVRVLCAGGTRDGNATADGFVATVPPAGREDEATITELPSLLLSPMIAPIWLEDTAAVYAQGAGRLVRVGRIDLVASELTSASPRAIGGSVATMSTGATFIVGGTDSAGAPLSGMWAFVPAP